MLCSVLTGRLFCCMSETRSLKDTEPSLSLNDSGSAELSVLSIPNSVLDPRVPANLLDFCSKVDYPLAESRGLEFDLRSRLEAPLEATDIFGSTRVILETFLLLK